MTETFVQTQVRLVLESQCAAAFVALLKETGPEGGNGAWKTTLPVAEAVATFEALLASWRTGTRRYASSRESARLVELDMRAIGASIETPAGVVYSLLVGRGEVSSYISTCERQGVIESLEQELLPIWRSDATRGANG